MNRRSLSAAAGMLMLAQLACRPVFAVGWGELLGILLLTLLLLGPVLLRLIRAWIQFQESKDKDRAGR